MRSDTLISRSIKGGDFWLKWEYGQRHGEISRRRRRMFLGILLVVAILVAGYVVAESDDFRGLAWVLQKLPLEFAGAPSEKDERDVKEYTRSEFLMDTYVSMRAAGPDSEEAVAAAFDEMRRIESLMSRYSPESDVSRVNSAAGGNPVKVSDETFYVIEKAIWCANQTRGAFDITIGPLMDVWDFRAEAPSVPDTAGLEEALSLVGWELVELDTANKTVRLPIQGMSIDLGGVAKGYAAREGARILKEHGVSHALIDAGGNIVTVGTRVDGSPWRIGIRDPRGNSMEDTIGPALSVTDSAVATSGDYERLFMEGGNRYHHILHPETGMPVDTVMSATVIAKDSLYADMLSTAVFVLGPDEGMKFIDTLEGVSAMIVDSSGNTLFSSGFDGV